MAKKITFLAGIAREGTAGSVRGKIPAGLIKAIGAQEGQGIEFMVHGNTLVGAKVLTAKEFKMAQREKASEAPAKKVAPKATKPKSVGKSTQKPAKPVRTATASRTPKKVAKPSKRKTEVEYEAPKVARKVKKPIKPVVKLKRKK